MRFLKFKNVRVRFFKPISFFEVPEVTYMADVYCILQDTDSLVSKYQIPAKMSDALAMGVPIMITDVPAISDLSEYDFIIKSKYGDYADNIKYLLENLNLYNIRERKLSLY